VADSAVDTKIDVRHRFVYFFFHLFMDSFDSSSIRPSDIFHLNMDAPKHYYNLGDTMMDASSYFGTHPHNRLKGIDRHKETPVRDKARPIDHYNSTSVEEDSIEYARNAGVSTILPRVTLEPPMVKRVSMAREVSYLKEQEPVQIKVENRRVTRAMAQNKMSRKSIHGMRLRAPVRVTFFA
jgi:hypothetical protein